MSNIEDVLDKVLQDTTMVEKELSKIKDEAKAKETIKIPKTLHPLIRNLIGKMIILFGKPRVGKTTFYARLARKLYDSTYKKALFYWLDENVIDTDFGKAIRRISNAEVRVIYDPTYLVWKVYSDMRKANLMSKYSMVVIDSLTGVSEYIAMLKGRDPESPQVTMITSRIAGALTLMLAKIAHRNKIPTILVAHSTEGWETYEGQKEYPGYISKGEKNADVILYMFKEVNTLREKGVETVEINRFIKVLEFRHDPDEPTDFLWAVYNVDELV